MPAIVTLCGGFLLGVLWMDLLFDVQVLPHRMGDLPESVLSSIAREICRNHFICLGAMLIVAGLEIAATFS